VYSVDGKVISGLVDRFGGGVRRDMLLLRWRWGRELTRGRSLRAVAKRAGEMGVASCDIFEESLE